MKTVKEKTKMKKLFVIFAVLCLAAPAMAADWNFYGSARMATFYTNADADENGVDDVKNTEWAQQGNSRIGATVKVNDQIGGGFEMSDSFGKRKLYGTYTFAGGSQLMLGQNYTPSTSFYSNSVWAGDGDLLGVGQFYIGRSEMIQWKTGGFKVALINPTEIITDDDILIPGLDASDFYTEVVIPKIEVSYQLKADAFFMDVFGGYNTFDLKADNAVVTGDVSVDSYVVGIGGGMNFGAFFCNLGGHYGQNLGNYGAYDPALLGKGTGIDDNVKIDAAGQEKDNTGWGALAVVGFNVSEMWTIEAGYGYEYAENDFDNADGENVSQYYLNATINIAPGFFIVPEVGYVSYDYEKELDGSDPNPNVTYFGAKWQINF